MELPPLWQITPLGLAAVAFGICHEMGVRRLAFRQSPEHRLRTRRRSWILYAGLALLVVVVSGPLERWGMQYLAIHMVIHVLEMFYIPPILIVSAPTIPLIFAVPVERRRRLQRAIYHSRATATVRRVRSAVGDPIVAVVLFNATMVLWHVPVIFDWASWHNWAMNWLMGPSFVITGLMFWRVILPSGPWRARGAPRIQVFAIVVTGFEMLVLAMAMAIFTKTPWYSMNIAMNGAARALTDQRWAAGILWVCGDFWAIPALIVVLYRGFRAGGGVSVSIERALGRA
jgi:cytochrome c oxidase assembly factor CtaG